MFHREWAPERLLQWQIRDLVTKGGVCSITVTGFRTSTKVEFKENFSCRASRGNRKFRTAEIRSYVIYKLLST